MLEFETIMLIITSIEKHSDDVVIFFVVLVSRSYFCNRRSSRFLQTFCSLYYWFFFRYEISSRLLVSPFYDRTSFPEVQINAVFSILLYERSQEEKEPVMRKKGSNSCGEN